MLTCLGAQRDRISGLDLGADDYLTKPFDPAELAARVRAVLRRAGRAAPGNCLCVGTLEVNLDAHTATVDGKPLNLTPVEFKLLGWLMQHPGCLLTRDELLKQVWGYKARGKSRTVDVHINRLREKLGDAACDSSLIVTEHGAGYRFLIPAAKATSIP
jgi:DNA-binding response OmpR family regulator